MVVNLTPHDVIVGGCKFEASGTVARLAESTQEISKLWGMIPLVKTVYGAIENLPEPDGKTLYIVSGMVRTACPDRKDLVSPGALVRNEAGQVIGCKELITNA